jgi:hypothetical protein
MPDSGEGSGEGLGGFGAEPSQVGMRGTSVEKMILHFCELMIYKLT